VLYYTDWGSKASIVRSNLDGTNPTVIKTGLFNPNGLALAGDSLYVVDSNYKTRVANFGPPRSFGSLYKMDNNGSNLQDVLNGSSSGLMVCVHAVAKTLFVLFKSQKLSHRDKVDSR
jgi:sugar lactone lactonase YvrE